MLFLIYELLTFFNNQVSKVEKLVPTSKGVNLKVKVLSADAIVNKKHPDGTKIRIAETLVGDDTGCILFSARNGTEKSKKLTYIYFLSKKLT